MGDLVSHTTHVTLLDFGFIFAQVTCLRFSGLIFVHFVDNFELPICGSFQTICWFHIASYFEHLHTMFHISFAYTVSASFPLVLIFNLLHAPSHPTHSSNTIHVNTTLTYPQIGSL